MDGTLVACVAENSEQWHRVVQNLVLSLRRFAGDLVAVPFGPRAPGAPTQGP